MLISLRHLNRATLARQLLLARKKVSVSRALDQLLALQAQWPRPPFLALWSRIAGFRREQLIAPLNKRSLVRATSMRMTIHIMRAADYRAFRGPLQPGLTQGMLAILRTRAKDLDVAALNAQGRAFFAEPRSFDAFRTQLEQAHPKADVRAMAYAVRTHLPLIQLPSAATWGYPAKADFALAEDWLGGPIDSTGDSPNELIKRYLAAFGPATATDMQAWSGLSGLTPAFEALRPELVTFRDERRRELFDLPKAPRPHADQSAPVRLLPEFDSVVLGHKDRRRFVADEHRKAIYLSGARVRATFLVDGVVAGTWKLESAKKNATLVLEPFGRLAKSTRDELAREAELLAAFAEPEASSHAVRFA